MLKLGSQLLALKALQVAINHALKLDPSAWKQIQHLQGQKLSLQVEGWPFEFSAEFTKDGLTFPMGPLDSNTETTTQVRGQLSDFVDLIRADDKQAALANSQIELNGRSGLLLQLANIVQHLELDWASALQPLIGPVATQGLSQAFSKVKQTASQTHKTFKQDLKDYAQNEAHITPHTWEVEAFSAGVNEVRAQTDRLQAKVQRLKHRLSTHPSSSTKGPE